jgi:shikimate kinase
MTLWLVGMMGSGKTTAGGRAAARLGVRFVDVDEEIASDSGQSVPELWAERGEQAFREMEAAAIERVAGDRAIVSTGGGAVLDPASRARMKATGTVVWLRVLPDVAAARLDSNRGRPLLDDDPDPGARVAALLQERASAYEDAADYDIDTSELSVEEVAMRIEALWRL